MGEIKVLHCLNAPSWGGLEIYSTELIQELHKTGIKQAVLCTPGSRASDELQAAGIEVIHLPAKKFSKLQHTILVRKLVRERGFTHLHSHTSTHGLVGWSHLWTHTRAGCLVSLHLMVLWCHLSMPL